MSERRARTTGTGRVEAFSDAVIAIALTLLVLDLIVEHHEHDYVAELLAQWPRYLAYVTAFLTIASIWLSHHDACSRLVRVTPTVLVTNLLLLLGVALVPWPTALLASALAEAEPDLADARAAVTAYVVVSLVVAVGWTCMSTAVVRRPDLVGEPADLGWFRTNARLSLIAGAVSVLAGAVGWFAPVVALTIFLLVPAAFFTVTLRTARVL